MGRDRGMGREEEKWNRNVSRLHLKHKLIWNCTQAKSVLMRNQRSPSWVEGHWDLSCPSDYLSALPVHGGCLSPTCGLKGALTLSNTVSPEFPTTFQNRGGKTRKHQGLGQRRKDRQLPWKSEIVISQWYRDMIIWILSYYSWCKCT